MYTNVMVPVDGSSFAEHALPYAVMLARASHAALRIVMVHEPRPFGEAYVIQRSDVLEARQKEEEQDYLTALARRVERTLGHHPEASLLAGTPVSTLSRIAMRNLTDLIVMSTHGRGGLSRIWLGSVADALVRRVRVPTLLVRPLEENAPVGPALIGHVLVAVDGSVAAESAVTQAAQLCSILEADCTIVRVVTPPTHVISSSLADTARMTHEKTEARVREALDYLSGLLARATLLPKNTHTEVLTAPNPAAAILNYVEKQAVDVIAVGTRGAGGAARLLLGSVADKVIRGSHMPVLVCPLSRGVAEKGEHEQEAELQHT